MWLFRQSHKHINQETLSEYLDGRLQGSGLERVERRLEECDACRKELAELQATVAMMRQLPMETLRRSFVMSAPPPETARARPALALRAPNWVYAGAASIAALALAVTVSVDATGGLSSDPLRRDVAATAQAPAPTSKQVTVTSAATAESTSGTEDEGTATPSLAAAAPVPATADATVRQESAGGAGDSAPAFESAPPPLATPAAVAPSGGAGGGGPVATPEPAVESQDDGPDQPSTAAAAPTPPTPGQTAQEEPTDGGGLGGSGTSESAPPPLATPAPIVPTATAVPDSAPILTESAAADPASTTGPPDGGLERSPGGAAGDGDTSTLESQAAKALTVEEPTPVSETLELAVIVQDGDSSTSVWWRVLEAAAGVLAVAFLAGWVLRRRANRRDLA